MPVELVLHSLIGVDSGSADGSGVVVQITDLLRELNWISGFVFLIWWSFMLCRVVEGGRAALDRVIENLGEMENQMPNENRLSLDNDNALLLGNLKRSSAMAALSPKERQRMEAKSLTMPAPVPPVLRERNKKREDLKRKTAPNPVKVPIRSNMSYPERYMSPTDSLVSPVTKGVLARNRKPMRILNPWGPPKALENTFQGTLIKPLPALKPDA